MNPKIRYCFLLSMLYLMFSAHYASAQECVMVNFVRPGEQNMQEAYYSDFVEVAPKFPGGESELVGYFNTHRKYPRDAYELGIQGRVVCGFIVDVDGSIHNITVHRGPCRSLGEEAVRLIESMPKWIPGTVQGHKVPCYYVLTVPFRL